MGNNQDIHNERLEFLGDAILDAVVSDCLYQTFPDYDEGELTRLRSRIVKRKHLNSLAKKIGIDALIVHQMKKSQETKHILGNTIEALIGAIYYDRGYSYSKSFVENLLKREIRIEALIENDTDYKSILFQKMQLNKWELEFTSYEHIEDCEKQNHFITQICIDHEYIAEAKGWTKKDAEQKAAARALEKIGH